MMERLTPSQGDGFYWIRMRDGWQVAEWSIGGWWICGSDIEVPHDDFPDTEVLEVGSKVERT